MSLCQLCEIKNLAHSRVRPRFLRAQGGLRGLAQRAEPPSPTRPGRALTRRCAYGLMERAIFCCVVPTEADALSARDPGVECARSNRQTDEPHPRQRPFQSVMGGRSSDL